MKNSLIGYQQLFIDIEGYIRKKYAYLLLSQKSFEECTKFIDLLLEENGEPVSEEEKLKLINNLEIIKEGKINKVPYDKFILLIYLTMDDKRDRINEIWNKIKKIESDNPFNLILSFILNENDSNRIEDIILKNDTNALNRLKEITGLLYSPEANLIYEVIVACSRVFNSTNINEFGTSFVKLYHKLNKEINSFPFLLFRFVLCERNKYELVNPEIIDSASICELATIFESDRLANLFKGWAFLYTKDYHSAEKVLLNNISSNNLNAIYSLMNELSFKTPIELYSKYSAQKSVLEKWENVVHWSFLGLYKTYKLTNNDLQLIKILELYMEFIENYYAVNSVYANDFLFSSYSIFYELQYELIQYYSKKLEFEKSNNQLKHLETTLSNEEDIIITSQFQLPSFDNSVTNQDRTSIYFDKVYKLMGINHFHLKQFNDAKKYLMKAKSLNPGDNEIENYLGLINI